MRLMSCAIWVACSLLLFFEESHGADDGLRVSAKDGVISITSTKSTLPEIMARLSRELGMTINVYGASQTGVVPCTIQNASLWDTLHKLVPEWDAMTFSRTNRSAEVWLKGAPAGKDAASAPAAAAAQPAAPEPAAIEPAASEPAAGPAAPEAAAAEVEAEPAAAEPEPVVDENAGQTEGTVFSGDEAFPAAPDQAPPQEQESQAVDGQSPEAEQNGGGAQEETVVAPDQPPIPEESAPVTGEEIVQDAVVPESEAEARKTEGGEPVPQRLPSSRGRRRAW